MQGWIDMLLRTDRGWVIVDHKTFPGAGDAWDVHVRRYLPQVALYARAVAAATGEGVLEAVLHFPVVGAAAIVEDPGRFAPLID
jgi:ATP-dependent exoDNAse (exonuclease V) beta subunit